MVCVCLSSNEDVNSSSLAFFADTHCLSVMNFRKRHCAHRGFWNLDPKFGSLVVYRNNTPYDSVYLCQYFCDCISLNIYIHCCCADNKLYQLIYCNNFVPQDFRYYTSDSSLGIFFIHSTVLLICFSVSTATTGCLQECNFSGLNQTSYRVWQ